MGHLGMGYSTVKDIDGSPENRYQYRKKYL
jgi:hypothetical protein